MKSYLSNPLALLEKYKSEILRIKRRTQVQLNSIPYIPKTTILYSDEYNIKTDISLPSDLDRPRKILDYLLFEGCINTKQIVTPKQATIAQLKYIHDPRYISKMMDDATAERIFGQQIPPELMKQLFNQQRLMTGGTIKAAITATSTIHPKRIINLGGGFHHAYPDAGYAFCALNDVAIAITHLKNNGFNGKILIIDLDLHQGDANKIIFANDPNVITYSIHAESWDTSKAIANYDIALGPGIGDIAYLKSIKSTLPNIIQLTQPQLVFYLAGTDVAEDDRIGDWRISHNAIFERDLFVHNTVGKRTMIICTAGGYGKNAWRHTARFIAYLTANFDNPIPSDHEELLKRIKKLSTTLKLPSFNTKLESDDFDFDLSLFENRQKRTKLFDQYSPYAIECAMDACGILEHFKDIGFHNPHFDFNFNHPNGQSIRIFNNAEKKYLLVELILDQKIDFTPYKLLWIEWMLLQNPLISPSQKRPLLPGQTHPGLKCLDKFNALLVLLANNMHLDGIAFNPSHYHICSLAKGNGYFLNPKAEAHFRIAQALTANMTLYEATQKCYEGFSPAPNLPTFKWNPETMIIPLTDSIIAHFQSPKYQKEVEKFAAIELKKLNCHKLRYPHLRP